MEWTRGLDRVEPLVGSVTEPQAWHDAPTLRGLRGIFHLAAVVRHSRRHPEDVYRTNVEGTLGTLRVGARHRARVVFVSTSGTVGCFERPGDSADEDAPYCAGRVERWPYYHSKVLAERGARRLSEELGVELVIARPPVLLGPGDHRGRSTSILSRHLRGQLPFVIRGGMHFADVRDVARALVQAMKRADVRPIYHLPGTVCGVKAFFMLAEEVSGVSAPRLVLPYRLAWLLATFFERLGVLLRGEPLALLPDPVVIELASHYWSIRSNYAAAELDYQSRDARETLADTVAWLRENGL